MRSSIQAAAKKGEDMAWISVSFKSKSLNMPVLAELLVPQDKGGSYKVMVLLHDAGSDRTEWLLKSQIYDMVKSLPVVVIMPSGKNSFYVNTANGYAYMDYVTRELPEFVKRHFRVSLDSADWLIMGAGMGGYGALACGLNHAEQFGNAASFGGALDIVDIMDKGADWPKADMGLVFGTDMEKIRMGSCNIYSLCHEIPVRQRPRIMLCCGIQDDFFDMNQRFYEEIKDEYDVTCRTGDGGHDFTFWNEGLRELLPWFMDMRVRQEEDL